MAVDVAGASGRAPVRPADAVDAVDHALVTVELLLHRPSLRLTELATELGVGRATAHRLLRMMVYRGFAVQNVDRSYAAGPALGRARHADDAQNVPLLQARIRPFLDAASSTLGETVHLKVLIGIEAVCLDGVEGSRPLHTPAARGVRYPAEHTAAGLALLAALPRTELQRRYAGRPAASMSTLEDALSVTRRRGFGLIIGEGRAGITSVASLVSGSTGRPVAALSCSAPTLRLGRAQTVVTADLLQTVADQARSDNGPGADAPAHRSR